MSHVSHQAATSPQLKRGLALPHVVLYGLGVTIGAGIYVLVGPAAAQAGVHAPFAFILAALVMAPTALSLAELTSRFPVSAGEAAFVREGLQSPGLSLLVGFGVVAVGVISAAAISLGSAGYIRSFLDLPNGTLIPLVVLAMGAIAAWGIVESVSLAALMTVIEIGGLLLIVATGLWHDPGLVARIPEIVPTTFAPVVWSGIIASSLLAFFAFIGFEGIVNIAEEAKDPLRTLPRGIFLTLGIATLLYLLVSAIAIFTVGPEELAQSEAPLGTVFGHVTGAPPQILAAIAIVATLNGIVIQMIMASRVIYGLAVQGSLPPWLARVSPTTQTPLVATGLVMATVLVLALGFPLDGLAEMTSRVTLVIFTLTNLSLVFLKWRGQAAAAASFVVPMAVPIAGTIICAGFLAGDILSRLAG